MSTDTRAERDRLSTSEWYRALHARPEFIAAADEQRRAGDELRRLHPHKPYLGPNLTGGSRALAREFARLGITVTAEQVEERCRVLWMSRDYA
jgi:hypothetical protein